MSYERYNIDVLSINEEWLNCSKSLICSRTCLLTTSAVPFSWNSFKLLQKWIYELPLILCWEYTNLIASKGLRWRIYKMYTLSKLVICRQLMTTANEILLMIIIIDCLTSMIPLFCIFELVSRRLSPQQSPKNILTIILIEFRSRYTPHTEKISIRV